MTDFSELKELRQGRDLENIYRILSYGPEPVPKGVVHFRDTGDSVSVTAYHSTTFRQFTSRDDGRISLRHVNLSLGQQQTLTVHGDGKVTCAVQNYTPAEGPYGPIQNMPIYNPQFYVNTLQRQAAELLDVVRPLLDKPGPKRPDSPDIRKILGEKFQRD